MRKKLEQVVYFHQRGRHEEKLRIGLDRAGYFCLFKKKNISNSLGCIVLNVTTVQQLNQRKKQKKNKRNFTDGEHRTYQMWLKWLQNILAQREAQRVLSSTVFLSLLINSFQSKHRTNQHIKIYLLTQ